MCTYIKLSFTVLLCGPDELEFMYVISIMIVQTSVQFVRFIDPKFSTCCP